MGKTEVFLNPTVKQVVFQIRYPNLFFIENKIGDFQLKVMSKFPNTSLMFRRQFLLANLGPKANLDDIPQENLEGGNTKIWQFKSEDDIELNVLADSLDISSTSYKTYDNINHDKRFRDIINFVVDAFIEITNVPVFNRMGLRYIDECPLFEKTNTKLSESFT